MRNKNYISPEEVSLIPVNKITDELIRRYFYGTHYISRAKLKNIPDNIKQYLNNRYSDSFSYKETVTRIKFGIEDHPKCQICGKYMPFTGGQKAPFHDKICSRSCKGKYNAILLQQKTGERSTLRLPEVKAKTVSSLQKHYGKI